MKLSDRNIFEVVSNRKCFQFSNNRLSAIVLNSKNSPIRQIIRFSHDLRTILFHGTRERKR